MIVIKSFLLTTIQALRDYALFSILFAIILLYLRHRKGMKNNLGCFLLYMYSALIWGVTILSRISGERVITEDFLGIRQLFENPWYIVSFAENIVMFIPFGIFYMLAFGNSKPNANVPQGQISEGKRQCLKWSAVMSVSIECLQGIFHLGEAQVIDIFANIMGTLLGWLMIDRYRKNKVN